MYFLCYVDDLIMTRNNNDVVVKFVEQLSHRFSLKYLGELNYFLGVEVLHVPNGLILTQHKYVRELLEKFDMTNLKSMTTPMANTQKLKLKDGTGSADAIAYRQVIGILQYLSLMRPDISYAVNNLAQFMRMPSQQHWTTFK